MGKKEEESPGPDQACTSVSSLTNYPWGPVEERSRDNGPTGPLYQPRRVSLPRPSLRPQIQREHGGTCCHIAPSPAEGGPWAVPPGALVPPPTPHLAGAGRSGSRRAPPVPPLRAHLAQVLQQRPRLLPPALAHHPQQLLDHADAPVVGG